MLTTAGSFTGLYASGVTQSTFSYATFTPPAPNAFSTSPPPRSRSQHFPFLRLGDGQLGYNPPLRRQRHRLNYNDWLAHTSTSLGAQAVQFSGGWFGKDSNSGLSPHWANPSAIDFHLSPRGRWNRRLGPPITDNLTSMTIDAGHPNDDFSLETGADNLLSTKALRQYGRSIPFGAAALPIAHGLPDRHLTAGIRALSTASRLSR